MEPQQLVRMMLELDEPWRDRFVSLTANLATGGNWCGEEEPGQRTLVRWLTHNSDLRRRMTLMMTTWRRPRLDKALDPRTDLIVHAGPEAPEQAICPACREEVEIRHRTDSDTWFYRHRAGGNGNCPRRARRPGE
jgi:hypothetical protein